MDRIQQHLETIPIGMIAILASLAIFFAMVVPKKFGFYFSVFLMLSWVNLSKYLDLRLLASASKVTYWLPPLLVIFFASCLPGPRRKVPQLAWVYLICPVLGVFCISGAEDFLYGVVQFSTMFLYAAAAIALYRVTTSSQKLINVMVAMFLGVLVPVAIAFVALVIFRGSSFRAGVARFEPFGMSSNQYVHFLATACCFAGLGFMTIKTKWIRLFCLGVIAACGAMVIASGSRQGLVIVAVAMLPSIRWGIKRPIVLALGIACVLAAGVWVFTFTEGVGKTERITDFTHTSNRYETALHYFQTFLSRPAGLLGTHGQKVSRDSDAERITHNSYLRMAYLGGVALAAPLLFVWVKSMFSMIYVLRNKKKLSIDDTLLGSMAVLLLAIYLQGMVSDLIYISVTSWTFLHYFLSCFFMGMATELKHPAATAYPYSPMTPTPAMR